MGNHARRRPRLHLGRILHNAAPVAILSDAWRANTGAAPAAALGKRIRNARRTPWREIVGVVGDERQDGVDQAGADDGLLADGDERLLGPAAVRAALA